MHAFLLIGSDPEKLTKRVEELAKNVNAKTFPFPIAKIDDVRALNDFVRLSFKESTLIFCQNIDEAGEEALNAFLKNLEEPQDNIYFALTARSARKVLPTIASRCQIIRIKNAELPLADENEIEHFLNLSTGEKLLYIDRIKDRIKAIEFAENMVNFMHGSMHENGVKYNITKENLTLALKTLTRLKRNGNVNLTLSNFVVNYAE